MLHPGARTEHKLTSSGSASLQSFAPDYCQSGARSARCERPSDHPKGPVGFMPRQTAHTGSPRADPHTGGSPTHNPLRASHDNQHTQDPPTRRSHHLQAFTTFLLHVAIHNLGRADPLMSSLTQHEAGGPRAGRCHRSLQPLQPSPGAIQHL